MRRGYMPDYHKPDKQTEKRARALLGSSLGGQGVKLAFVVVAAILSAALTAIYALIVREAVNEATSAEGSLSRVIRCAAALGAAVLVQCALTLFSGLIRENLRARTEILLRKRAFDSVLCGDYAALSSHHSGDIQNRIFSDSAVAADGAARILPNLASAVSQLVFCAVTLFLLQPVYTAILLAASAVAFCFAVSFRKVMKRLHKETREADGRSREFMQESVENLLAVQVFEAQGNFSRKAEKLLDGFYRAAAKQNRFTVFAMDSVWVAFRVFYVAALIVGLFAIFRGDTDYGTLTAMLQLVSQIQSPVISLSGIGPRYYMMVASAERLSELETEAPPKKQGRPAAEFYGDLKAFVFENVTFDYGRESVLENVNLRIQKGDFTVIKGESGIGKSTLLKLLLGVYKPVKGEVFAETYRGKEESADGLFAYVPQGNMLFSGTVRENLLFINEKAEESEIARALSCACAQEFVSALPDGLETRIGENGFGLSEGQVQRLAIARALLTGAPVLLLDEATSALDVSTERELLFNLRGMGGKTVILITHKQAAETLADAVITIKNKEVSVL